MKLRGFKGDDTVLHEEHGSKIAKAASINITPFVGSISASLFMIEPEQSALLNHLAGSSKERPVSREYLQARTCWSDRRIRKIISELQENGFWIVSLDRGYYLTDSKADLESYKRRETHRAVSILRKLRSLVPAAGEALKQLEMGF